MRTARSLKRGDCPPLRIYGRGTDKPATHELEAHVPAMAEESPMNRTTRGGMGHACSPGHEHSGQLFKPFLMRSPRKATKAFPLHTDGLRV